jgi:hypothetical protein
VQQRALDKANDPGLWDTLMGGMVSAADTVATALARETWEVVPEGLAPVNQDGEVAQFALLDRAELLHRLAQNQFTTEAALILVAALQR